MAFTIKDWIELFLMTKDEETKKYAELMLYAWNTGKNKEEVIL